MPSDLAALQQRLDFALAAALTAEEIINRYYQTGVQVDKKRDRSPVTVADRSSEEAIRAEIGRQFPDDAILGEEYGESAGTSGYRWILDPVDGTKSFIHGVPLFGTLIGLEHEERCVLGVCHLPALGETVWGATGLGSWWKRRGEEPRRAQVSRVTDPAEALCCFTTVQGFGRIGRQDAFDQLASSVGLLRGWGDCYGHILVATGRAEMMVDPLMNPWDAAALIPIMEEAGGAFVDWNGVTTIYSGNGISVCPGLKQHILSITRTV